ncbi:hypothetical protein GCM10010430_79710 [Kitasatospora cystarginea]|uniref:MFS transporter n=1 Tax=Kitasatospora cystarginea TaxID=58350 RepID=A0ABP5RYP3_9ACTN
MPEAAWKGRTTVAPPVPVGAVRSRPYRVEEPVVTLLMHHRFDVVIAAVFGLVFAPLGAAA